MITVNVYSKCNDLVQVFELSISMSMQHNIIILNFIIQSLVREDQLSKQSLQEIIPNLAKTAVVHGDMLLLFSPFSSSWLALNRLVVFVPLNHVLKLIFLMKDAKPQQTGRKKQFVRSNLRTFTRGLKHYQAVTRKAVSYALCCCSSKMKANSFTPVFPN